MGVIDRAIAANNSSASASRTATDGSGRNQQKTQDKTVHNRDRSQPQSIPDTFLNEFDTSNIKLNDKTVSRLLSAAVVLTNLLN